MTAQENDRNQGNLPGKHPTGPWDQGHEHLNPKDESYGQDKDVTNLNRDHQHVNAANQSVEGKTPDFSRQGRDGQRPHPETRAGSDPQKGRDESRRNQAEPNRRDVYSSVPENSPRKEEREKQVPKSGEKITNSQGNDGFKGNIDDSSKFSE
jgi:hypothetical protein